MNRPATINDYHKRVIRVVDYIYDNLNGDLSSSKLAEVACFSEYHWHRIYRGISGETITQTIRRLRLHLAAFELITSNKSIATIESDAGYSAVESFSRAFQKDFDVPPASYRKDKQRDLYIFNQFEDTTMYELEIKTIENMNAVGYTHKGSYADIGKTFERLFSWHFAAEALQNLPHVFFVSIITTRRKFLRMNNVPLSA